MFFILLFIPMSCISKKEKSLVENRYLAKKPMLIVDKKFNLNFGKDFNDWFNDRFAARKIMINSNTSVKCILNRKSCQNGNIIYNKKYNLIYRDNFWGMELIEGDKKDILNTYVNNINRFKKYCDKENIKPYILIIPRQYNFFNIDISDVRKNSPDPAEKVIEHLKKNTNVKILYPKEEMAIANKTTPVFFKTDHHWTKRALTQVISNL